MLVFRNTTISRLLNLPLRLYISNTIIVYQQFTVSIVYSIYQFVLFYSLKSLFSDLHNTVYSTSIRLTACILCSTTMCAVLVRGQLRDMAM
jgi:hypothetical protein